MEGEVFKLGQVWGGMLKVIHFGLGSRQVPYGTVADIDFTFNGLLTPPLRVYTPCKYIILVSKEERTDVLLTRSVKNCPGRSARKARARRSGGRDLGSTLHWNRTMRDITLTKTQFTPYSAPRRSTATPGGAVPIQTRESSRAFIHRQHQRRPHGPLGICAA
jgi:hypothetical protein